MKKNIVLIGMPGCGKSTIGLKLSKKLNLKFIDVDTYIEEQECETISSMFEKGEAYFRDIESKYIEKLSSLNSTVIATGGGAVKKRINMDLLKKNSYVIYVNRSIDEILMDLDDSTRPLLKDKKQKLYQLYDERHYLYEKYSDIEITNNKEIDILVDEIKEICIRERII